MNIFIFLCNQRTENECMRKNLFGIRGSWINEVQADAVCLLYNFQSQVVYGIWRATGAKGVLEETAFDGLAPNQVRVNLVSENGIVRVTKSEIEKLSGRSFSRPYPIKIELEEKELQELFGDGAKTASNIVHVQPDLEEDFRQRFPREFHCDDGHDVRSQGETMIDNWLFKHNICHGYEVLMDVPERMYCDFVVSNVKRQPVYIEYWGLEGDEKYLERKEKKRGIYSRHKLPLVELIPVDIKNLDFAMRAKLKTAKVIN